jgi:hypothetical protein
MSTGKAPEVGVGKERDSLVSRDEAEESEGEENEDSMMMDPAMAAERMAAEQNTAQRFNFEPLLTKLFTSEKDLLDTIHAIFPKGVKVCRKDKWKAGEHAGMHKKWRFVCECGGLPRRNFNGSPARRTKKIGCPFFINAFWSKSQGGPRITTASLFHCGHDEVEVNEVALAALCQEQRQLSLQMAQENIDSSDPIRSVQQKEMLLASLKLKMDYHLKYMMYNYPVDVVVARVNEFLSPPDHSNAASASSDGANLLGFNTDVDGAYNQDYSRGPHAAKKRKEHHY